MAQTHPPTVRASWKSAAKSLRFKTAELVPFSPLSCQEKKWGTSPVQGYEKLDAQLEYNSVNALRQRDEGDFT
jgi:hypothetical protein